jgi:hypothetical protein
MTELVKLEAFALEALLAGLAYIPRKNATTGANAEYITSARAGEAGMCFVELLPEGLAIASIGDRGLAWFAWNLEAAEYFVVHGLLSSLPRGSWVVDLQAVLESFFCRGVGGGRGGFARTFVAGALAFFFGGALGVEGEEAVEDGVLKGLVGEALGRGAGGV